MRRVTHWLRLTGALPSLLKRKADETKTSDLAKSAVTQAAQAKQKLIGQLKEKWTADESVIEAARRTIEEKLSALGAKFAFQARPGSPEQPLRRQSSRDKSGPPQGE